ISHVLGWGEATWDAADGVRWWNGKTPDPATTRLMFFPGKVKPWELAATGADPWVAEHYRRFRDGWCLILGYHPSVWTEAEDALARHHFDAVVAAPEAAEHWKQVDAVAVNDDHAERLAWMMGFARDRTVFCGRQREVA